MGRSAIHPGVLATLLGGLAMLGPFSIGALLPAFPGIQLSLHTSELAVQQTLTAYLISFGGMMLWHGALSDAFGRRPVILASLVIFGIATLGCATAQNMEALWFFRILQGVSSGAGTILGNAIIRDQFQGPQAARLLSLVAMIFAIGPGIAPIIGGWIVKLFDWRAIFFFVLGYTVLLLAGCFYFLQETLPQTQRKGFHPRVLFNSYKKIFSSKPGLLKMGVLAFNFSGMFLYIAAAPVFITRHLHLGPEQFGWQFIPMVSGIFLGSLLANRIAETVSIPRQIFIGYFFAIGAGLVNVSYHLFFPAALPWSVLPLFFYALGISVIVPGTVLLLLELMPDLRGTVVSCQGFSQIMLASATAGILVPLIASKTLWLALGELGFGLLSLICWLTIYFNQTTKQASHD